MANACINVKPVKGGSEEHNKRTKALDYVRPDLPHEYWQSQSQAEVLASIKDRYKNTTGQTLQKKATPIREGVVLVDEGTTMSDLRQLADRIQQEFGVRTFQIALHLDEGHWDEETHQWNPNRHAHLVFDWTNEDGTTIKLNRNDMSRMQTMVADHLHMKRGHSSDKEHLTAQQYKIGKEIEKLNERLAEAQKTSIWDAMKVNALDKVEASEQYKSLESRFNKAKSAFNELKEEGRKAVEQAREERDKAIAEKDSMESGNLYFSQRIEELEEENDKLRKGNSSWWEEYRPWQKIDQAVRAIINIARSGRNSQDELSVAGGIKRLVEWARHMIDHISAGRLLIDAANLKSDERQEVTPTIDEIARNVEREQGYRRGL